MTAPAPTLPLDYDGKPGPWADLPARWADADDEIAYTRYYYRDPAGAWQYVDYDGRLMAFDAVAVKKFAQLSPQALLDGIQEHDPEAVRAFVWMLRRHRGGERNLPLEQVDLDLLSWQALNMSGDGQVLVGRPLVHVPDPDPDDLRRLAAAIAGAVGSGLWPDDPDDDPGEAFAGLVLRSLLARRATRAAEAGPGEDDAAGADTAGGPSPTT